MTTTTDGKCAIKGYKFTRFDLTDSFTGKQYACPGEFEESTWPSVDYYIGMRFNKFILDTILYEPETLVEYDDCDSINHKLALCARVFVVESYGLTMSHNSTVSTNKLRFIRELSIPEIVNELNHEMRMYKQWHIPDFRLTSKTYANKASEFVDLIAKNADRLEEQRLVHISLHNSELD